MSDNASPEPAPIPIAVAVVEHQGRFLVGVRPAETTLAGMAEFPGGKIEPGETLAAAAVRECLEETGLAVQVSGVYSTHVQAYDYGRVALHFLACQLCQADASASSKPRPPFKWVPRSELAVCEFPAGNRRLVEHLLGRDKTADGD